MKRQPLSLRPHDVCVLLQFALKPEMTVRELSHMVGLSLGEAHNATKRLVISRLIPPGGGMVNQSVCFDFLVSGVPYVFPRELGPEVRGVPTAHLSPRPSAALMERNRNIHSIRRLGRREWHKRSGFCKRSMVENAIYRF